MCYWETWETKCPKCGFIFGGRITQLEKVIPMTCSNCGERFAPDIVSPAGCIRDDTLLTVRLDNLNKKIA